MTMTGEKMTQSSQGQSSQSQVQANTEGLDVSQIASIQLSDGWHDITNPQFVHFAVGEAHSPLTPSKFYPTIRYKNEYGQNCWTPLGSILSYSNSPSSSNVGSNRSPQGSSSR